MPALPPLVRMRRNLCGGQQAGRLSTVRFYSSAQTTTVTVELESARHAAQGQRRESASSFLRSAEHAHSAAAGHACDPGGATGSSARSGWRSTARACRVVLELEHDSSVEVSVLANPARLNFEVRLRSRKFLKPHQRHRRPPRRPHRKLERRSSRNGPPRSRVSPSRRAGDVVLANPPAEAPAPESEAASTARKPLAKRSRNPRRP